MLPGRLRSTCPLDRSAIFLTLETFLPTGVPCIFWQDWEGPLQETLKQLIQVRQQARVSSVSSWEVVKATQGIYAGFVGNWLAVKVGSAAWSPNQVGLCALACLLLQWLAVLACLSCDLGDHTWMGRSDTACLLISWLAKA